MTGSGLYLSRDERDPTRQNQAIQQLIEGRSNAVGLVTLAAGQTSTTVSAPSCGPNSAVFLSPANSAAASQIASTYVPSNAVSAKQFIITHPSAGLDTEYWWVCLG